MLTMCLRLSTSSVSPVTAGANEACVTNAAALA